MRTLLFLYHYFRNFLIFFHKKNLTIWNYISFRGKIKHNKDEEVPVWQ